jgi:hypothetical protein
MIELLVMGAVGRIVSRIGGRWLDEAADALDVGLRGAAKRLAAATYLPDGTGREAQVAAAATDLAEYAAANPLAAAELLQATLAGPKAMTRIERFNFFVDSAIELIVGLGRPVALPGFFNCTSCVVVIDARTTSGFDLAMPYFFEASSGDPNDRSVSFGELGKYGDPVWIPRFWLIRAASDERRDELLIELDRRFRSKPPSLHEMSNRILVREALGLRETEHAEWIGSIDVRSVSVNATDRAPASTDADYLIADPSGINLMREALMEQVMAQMKADGVWTAATNLGWGPEKHT